MNDLLMQIGGLVLKAWQDEKRIRVLEARIAELALKDVPPAQPGGP